ncbi:MAG: 2-iminoacetate synthase ThiH [Flavobacteriales bacterium]|nr:2-iminoacetate synthase ThiH [Flavobacteriales bacterium]
MMFKELFDTYNWSHVHELIYSRNESHVINAIETEYMELNDFAALISPAAEKFIESMAKKSKALTQERFGKTINLFAPFYLSNECQNICTYCGFSLNNKIKRKTLSDSEIIKECEALKEMGFEHILLVTGEANNTVGMDYFLNALKLIKPYFANISMEVQPLTEEEYALLGQEGVHSILVYQETYNRDAYKEFHPKGKKSNFHYRLATPDRIGQAKVHKVGIGALLGLSDWRVDTFFTALHLKYLEKKYWETKYSISFPRLRPFSGGEIDPKMMTDKDLAQVICAYRIFDQEVELSLSTRESEKFRNNIIQLGITSMSAGSKTNPGGYAVEEASLEQFEIDDKRTPEQVRTMIEQNGKEVVWKDWDKSYEMIA